MPYLPEYLEVSHPKLVNPQEQNECIFISKNGRMITTANIGDLLRRYLKKAGLEIPMTPHTIRHACARHLLANGCGIRVIQELLGHERLTATCIYTVIEKNTLLSIVNSSHPRTRA